MTTTQTNRIARRIQRAAQNARIEAAHAATRDIVASGKCPDCGGPLRCNLSITGWWQCKQFGAVGFRADASKPSCDWQGFTR